VPKAKRFRALLKRPRQRRDRFSGPALLDKTLRPLELIHGRFLQRTACRRQHPCKSARQ
jgi:hypothetical protein